MVVVTAGSERCPALIGVATGLGRLRCLATPMTLGTPLERPGGRPLPDSTPQGPRHPPSQPGGAPRHLLGRRRARVPRLRFHRALRAAADLRAHPRWHRRGETTRPTTGSPAARPGDGFRRTETHRSRSVARSSAKTARNWPGNGLQTRRRNARRSFFALNVILGTNLPMPDSRPFRSHARAVIRQNCLTISS